MYITTLNFNKVLEWFTKESGYEYMMLFVSSYRKSDQEIVKYFIQEKSRIDRITGEDICFFHFVESSIIQSFKMESATSKMMLWHINDFRSHNGEDLLDSQSLMCGVGMQATTEISESISEYFKLMAYRLPAFILINRDMSKYSLFTIKQKNDLEAILEPILIINNFQNCIGKIENELYALNKTDNHDRLRLKLESIKKEKTVLLNDKSIHNADELEDEFIARLISFGIDESLCNEIRSNPQGHRKILFGTKAYQNSGIMELGKEWMLELKCKNKIEFKQSKVDSINKRISDISILLLSEDRDVKIVKLNKELEDIRRHYKKEIEKELLVDDGNVILQIIENNKSTIPIIFESIFEKVALRNQTIEKIKEELHKKIQQKAFDIFISCKSEDYDKAKELYDHLKDNGLQPFIASISIREVGVDGFGDLIRQVIDICKHMVVFATKLDYITTPYVHAEWNLFLDEQTAGRKKGHLISVIPDMSEVNILPSGLRNKQCYDLNNYKDNLYMFLK